MKHQITEPDFAYIGSMAEVLCNSMGIHLSIHDLSGVFRTGIPLDIPLKYKYHNNEFCSSVKSSSTGWRYCAMCKNMSLKRVSGEKKEYFSRCYMGICEIVKPILIDGRPVAVIYLGNFYLKENREEVVAKLKKAAEKIGLTEQFVMEQFKTVKAASAEDLKTYYQTVEVLSYSILLAYQGMFAKNSIDLSLGGSHRKQWLVQSIKDYVLVHYYNSIRLESIAKVNFFNANYLGSLFKKETGLTFTEYLNSVRLDRAKELLTSTDMKIIDISVQVGFENVTYFNRVFKKETGRTPLEYREEMKSII